MSAAGLPSLKTVGGASIPGLRSGGPLTRGGPVVQWRPKSAAAAPTIAVSPAPVERPLACGEWGPFSAAAAIGDSVWLADATEGYVAATVTACSATAVELAVDEPRAGAATTAAITRRAPQSPIAVTGGGSVLSRYAVASAAAKPLVGKAAGPSSAAAAAAAAAATAATSTPGPLIFPRLSKEAGGAVISKALLSPNTDGVRGGGGNEAELLDCVRSLWRQQRGTSSKPSVKNKSAATAAAVAALGIGPHALVLTQGGIAGGDVECPVLSDSSLWSVAEGISSCGASPGSSRNSSSTSRVQPLVIVRGGDSNVGVATQSVASSLMRSGIRGKCATPLVACFEAAFALVTPFITCGVAAAAAAAASSAGAAAATAVGADVSASVEDAAFFAAMSGALASLGGGVSSNEGASSGPIASTQPDTSASTTTSGSENLGWRGCGGIIAHFATQTPSLAVFRSPLATESSSSASCVIRIAAAALLCARDRPEELLLREAFQGEHARVWSPSTPASPVSAEEFDAWRATATLLDVSPEAQHRSLRFALAASRCASLPLVSSTGGLVTLSQHSPHLASLSALLAVESDSLHAALTADFVSGETLTFPGALAARAVLTDRLHTLAVQPLLEAISAALKTAATPPSKGADGGSTPSERRSRHGRGTLVFAPWPQPVALTAWHHRIAVTALTYRATADGVAHDLRAVPHAPFVNAASKESISCGGSASLTDSHAPVERLVLSAALADVLSHSPDAVIASVGRLHETHLTEGAEELHALLLTAGTALEMTSSAPAAPEGSIRFVTVSSSSPSNTSADFHAQHVLAHLRANDLVAVTAARRAAWPFSAKPSEFVSAYGSRLLPRAQKRGALSRAASASTSDEPIPSLLEDVTALFSQPVVVDALTDACSAPTPWFTVGSSGNLHLRAAAISILNMLANDANISAVTMLQAAIRCHAKRTAFISLRRGMMRLQAVIRSRGVRRVFLMDIASARLKKTLATIASAHSLELVRLHDMCCGASSSHTISDELPRLGGPLAAAVHLSVAASGLVTNALAAHLPDVAQEALGSLRERIKDVELALTAAKALRSEDEAHAARVAASLHECGATAKALIVSAVGTLRLVTPAATRSAMQSAGLLEKGTPPSSSLVAASASVLAGLAAANAALELLPPGSSAPAPSSAATSALSTALSTLVMAWQEHVSWHTVASSTPLGEPVEMSLLLDALARVRANLARAFAILDVELVRRSTVASSRFTADAALQELASKLLPVRELAAAAGVATWRPVRAALGAAAAVLASADSAIAALVKGFETDDSATILVVDGEGAVAATASKDNAATADAIATALRSQLALVTDPAEASIVRAREVVEEQAALNASESASFASAVTAVHSAGTRLGSVWAEALNADCASAPAVPTFQTDIDSKGPWRPALEAIRSVGVREAFDAAGKAVIAAHKACARVASARSQQRPLAGGSTHGPSDELAAAAADVAGADGALSSTLFSALTRAVADATARVAEAEAEHRGEQQRRVSMREARANAISQLAAPLADLARVEAEAGGLGGLMTTSASVNNALEAARKALNAAREALHGGDVFADAAGNSAAIVAVAVQAVADARACVERELPRAREYGAALERAREEMKLLLERLLKLVRITPAAVIDEDGVAPAVDAARKQLGALALFIIGSQAAHHPALVSRDTGAPFSAGASISIAADALAVQDAVASAAWGPLASAEAACAAAVRCVEARETARASGLEALTFASHRVAALALRAELLLGANAEAAEYDDVDDGGARLVWERITSAEAAVSSALDALRVTTRARGLFSPSDITACVDTALAAVAGAESAWAHPLHKTRGPWCATPPTPPVHIMPVPITPSDLNNTASSRGALLTTLHSRVAPALTSLLSQREAAGLGGNAHLTSAVSLAEKAIADAGTRVVVLGGGGSGGGSGGHGSRSDHEASASIAAASHATHKIVAPLLAAALDAQAACRTRFSVIRKAAEVCIALERRGVQLAELGELATAAAGVANLLAVSGEEEESGSASSSSSLSTSPHKSRSSALPTSPSSPSAWHVMSPLPTSFAAQEELRCIDYVTATIDEIAEVSVSEAALGRGSGAPAHPLSRPPLTLPALSVQNPSLVDVAAAVCAPAKLPTPPVVLHALTAQRSALAAAWVAVASALLHATAFNASRGLGLTAAVTDIRQLVPDAHFDTASALPASLALDSSSHEGDSTSSRIDWWSIDAFGPVAGGPLSHETELATVLASVNGLTDAAERATRSIRDLSEARACTLWAQRRVRAALSASRTSCGNWVQRLVALTTATSSAARTESGELGTAAVAEAATGVSTCLQALESLNNATTAAQAACTRTASTLDNLAARALAGCVSPPASSRADDPARASALAAATEVWASAIFDSAVSAASALASTVAVAEAALATELQRVRTLRAHGTLSHFSGERTISPRAATDSHGHRLPASSPAHGAFLASGRWPTPHTAVPPPLGDSHSGVGGGFSSGARVGRPTIIPPSSPEARATRGGGVGAHLQKAAAAAAASTAAAAAAAAASSSDAGSFSPRFLAPTLAQVFREEAIRRSTAVRGVSLAPPHAFTWAEER